MTANVQPAARELTDLAIAVRKDWDRTLLEGAIAQARSSGWSFPRVLLEVVRLLLVEDSSPRDLTAAARTPLARSVPVPPALNRERAAAARALLAARGEAS
jgi:hypothetical protein